jgi:hypothetical protein
MPPRSKVITMLPAYIRQEVERRLFENGFRDYEALAQWVCGQGYEISDDSLWRYGHNLQQQLTAMRLTVRLARSLGELAEDREPLMTRALITIARQKELATLAEKEEVTPGELNAIANLTRAAIAQQRWAAEAKAQGKPQPQTPANGKCVPPDKAHSNCDAQRAPAAVEQGRAASEEPAGRIDTPRETSPGDERHPPAERDPPERGIAVEGSSTNSGDGAFAGRIQPPLHPAPPRGTADLHASEGVIPFLHSGLIDAPSPSP